MRIIKNMQNFLLDQDYYIDMFNNCLHIYYYDTLNALSEDAIEIKLKEFTLVIEGSDLSILNMDNHEMLIKGVINNMRFIR